MNVKYSLSLKLVVQMKLTHKIVQTFKNSRRQQERWRCSVKNAYRVRFDVYLSKSGFSGLLVITGYICFLSQCDMVL